MSRWALSCIAPSDEAMGRILGIMKTAGAVEIGYDVVPENAKIAGLLSGPQKPDYRKNVGTGKGRPGHGARQQATMEIIQSIPYGTAIKPKQIQDALIARGFSPNTAMSLKELCRAGLLKAVGHALYMRKA